MRIEEDEGGFKPLRIVIETPEELAMLRSTLGYALNFLEERSWVHTKLQAWIMVLEKELQ
jgi:hypothetical protein